MTMSGKTPVVGHVEIPQNIAEFNSVSGIVLSDLWKVFPAPTRIVPNDIAVRLGLKSGDDRMPSGRKVAEVVHYTCDRLTEAGFIRTAGAVLLDGSRSSVLAERGFATMGRPLAAGHRAAGIDITDAAKPEVSSTPAGQIKLAEVVGTFFGRILGEAGKTIMGG
jgi:hypothetical protein